MTFSLTLYLARKGSIGLNDLNSDKFRLLPSYNQQDWLYPMMNYDFFRFTDSHECREVVSRKGVTYNMLRNTFGNLFTDSMLVLDSNFSIPDCFVNLLDKHVLSNYGCATHPNRYGEYTEIWMDLTEPSQFLICRPDNWRVHWISLILYFVKYGEFLTDIVGGYSGNDVTLDEAVSAVLDSWSGEVGFHTALALWLYANKDTDLIQGDGTWHNGIATYLSRYHTIFYPTQVFEFMSEYGLGADRLSRPFIDAHQHKIEQRGLTLPQWYLRGGSYYGDPSDSQEYREWMGYDDYDDDDDYDDYDDDDDFDLDEAW